MAETSTWAKIQEMVKEGENNLNRVKLGWQINHYYIKGTHNINVDYQSNRVVVLRPGTSIMTATGNKPVSNAILNYPIDNHLGTIAGSITAHATANDPILEVRPATEDDDDKDAAKNSTYLLRYYFDILKVAQIRDEAVEWLKSCGSVFIKWYWNNNAGPKVEAATGADGKPSKKPLGDPGVKICPSHTVLLPDGITKYDNTIPWVGEMSAYSLDEIKRLWPQAGAEVKAESNLKSIKSLTDDGEGQTLKNHANVYEFYWNPYGSGVPRHEIWANGVLLDAKPFDIDVWENFGLWNPLIMIGYVDIAGELWPGTIISDEVPLQKELNRLRRELSTSKKAPKGVFSSPKQTVEWHKVRLDSEIGIPHIEYDPSKVTGINNIAKPIDYLTINPGNNDTRNDIQEVKRAMDEIASDFPATRGQTDPRITSGEQFEKQKGASDRQKGPLLKHLAEGMIELGKAILYLCTCHFDSSGRLLRITGQNNDAISATFTPDDYKSDDIILSNGTTFFMSPEALQERTERQFSQGLYGDPKDPKVVLKVSKQLNVPTPEGVFDSWLKDINMAKWENREFMEGRYYETDPYFLDQAIAQDPAMMQYQQAMGEYQAIINDMMSTGMSQADAEMVHPPPQQPEPSKVYRRARPEDNSALHLEEHFSIMKTTDFEEKSKADPELRKAFYYHLSTHGFIDPSQQPAPQMPVNPSGAPPGNLPPGTPPEAAPGPPGLMGPPQ